MAGFLKSYVCGAGEEPLIYETIGNYFDDIAHRFGKEDALIVRHQNIRWTYNTYKEQVDSLATGLLKLDIGPGDRVGIWGPNSAEWAVTQFATAKIGAILVCINPAYRLYELEYALNKVECRAIVTADQFKSSHYIEMLQELAPELESCAPGNLKAERVPSLQTVIRMGDALTPGMLNYNKVLSLGGKAECQEMARLKGVVQPDDPINIQFTSGTTGNPKGATLTSCNILNNGWLSGCGMHFTHEDRLCIPVPLYHCFGMVLGNLLCVAHGAAAVYPGAGFNAAETLAAVQDEKCTALHGVPTMFIAELDHPEFDCYDVSSLRTGIMAGAPCPVEVMKRVITDMGMENILIGYGQTELSPLNHLTLPEDPLEKRVSTVGRAVPRIEVKIIADDGRVTPIGERGEICTRGYSVMRGYWNDAARTKETIDAGGWLHSGDLGVMDAQGYVQIVGRIKDMIIRGGENVYPREIEEFLYTHAKIQDVQVFGVPDKKLGEEVCAWIKLREGESLSSEEVKEFCKNRISHFKVPRQIRFVQDFPMTVTGKIQKFVMRDHMLSELQEMNR